MSWKNEKQRHALAARGINSKQFMKNLEEHDMGGGFSWGSCQYETAYDSYDYFTKALEKHGLSEVLEALESEGIRVDIRLGKDSFNDVKEGLKRKFNNQMKEARENNDEDWYEYGVDSYKDAEKIKDIDDAFEVLKDSAWDLWTAAPFISKQAGIRISNMPKAKGYGPSGNVLVQGSNHEVGLHCALLVHLDLVKDTSSFDGFDT